jgi:Flp pilus assembly protein TadB
MHVITSALLAVSVICLAEHLYRRSARRASTLAAAGLSEPGETVAPLRSRLASSVTKRLTSLGGMTAAWAGKDIQKLIAESGAGFSPLYFQGLRCASGLAAALLVLPLGYPAIPLIPVLLAAGYYLPVVLLKRKRRLLWERISRDLPEVIDLMAVICYSGESLFQALQCSTMVCGHPATREVMGAILERIRMGESVSEALSLAAQHPMKELRRLGRTLIRADEYGAPIAETLEKLASEFRSERRAKDRVRASRASVLILFPLVFLILPSFLLLTIGGMIIGYSL